MHEYDLIADWYASQRVDQTGVPEVTALASFVAAGSSVLDIGCGNGLPVTRTLLNAGHHVVGLDSSSAMLQRFRRNCPEAFAVQSLVQCLPFPPSVFDAAVAWVVMFHLNRDEAIEAIVSVSRVLKPGVPFLFTSGDEDGFNGREGTMNGVVFRYFSYSIEDYRRILADYQLTLTNTHVDSGMNTSYLATKVALSRTS